eukprot:s1636_g10.t1
MVFASGPEMCQQSWVQLDKYSQPWTFELVATVGGWFSEILNSGMIGKKQQTETRVFPGSGSFHSDLRPNTATSWELLSWFLFFHYDWAKISKSQDFNYRPHGAPEILAWSREVRGLRGVYSPGCLRQHGSSKSAMDLWQVESCAPEDVGLFFYKAAVNLSHLRPNLYQSIRAIEQSQASMACISIALQEVFQNRGPLDERSRQELLVAFARTNDEKYDWNSERSADDPPQGWQQIIGGLGMATKRKPINRMAHEAFQDLQQVPRHIGYRTVQGFLSCSNLDAAIQYLQKAHVEHGSLALQDGGELLVETAYAVEADAHDQRNRMCGLLALGDDFFPPLLACAFRVALAWEDVYALAVSALKGPGDRDGRDDVEMGMEALTQLRDDPAVFGESQWESSMKRTSSQVPESATQEDFAQEPEKFPEVLRLDDDSDEEHNPYAGVDDWSFPQVF